MQITLESIKTAQKQVAEMISTFEAQLTVAAQFPVTLSMPPLRAGERYVGAIISADGKKRHHVILLTEEISETNWKDAMAWAAGLNASLPDRVESALIFATLRDQFKPEWYWTNEQHAADSSCAWCQSFSNGNQYGYVKSAELRARAVRRLEIQ